MHVVAITLALLAQLPKADPKPIPWLADGAYAPESAVYELQCVTSQEELCQILAVMEWSVLLDAKRGVLRHFFDPVKFERFVPRARLAAAAEARAAEIGATVSACMEMGRMAPPLFDVCRLGPGKMGVDKAGAGKAAAPAAPKRATAK